MSTNVHPADELADIRSQIKALQSRESELRERLLSGTVSMRGDHWFATIEQSSRETVDKTALISALGRTRVEPFLKTSKFPVIKLVEAEPL